MRGSDPIRDLKRIRAWEEVLYTISVYLGSADVARQMLAHLTDIRDKFEASAFFRRHEVSHAPSAHTRDRAQRCEQSSIGQRGIWRS